jgi:DNA repair photolyase
MRWDNLKVEAEEGHRLPGYKDPATIRTFDAPEALDVRFYEVRARSVLNKVPKASRMPFRWTINPYRGCTHACTYCASGDTPVLMADGRHKPLADLRVGDRVYGTERRGVYRRYVLTEVLDHWESRKPALRVTLEDGTELVASGDHRFLSDRGWKHVTNNPRQPDRAHLTLNNRLIGTGKFAEQPADSSDYRRGYLCGIIRGDGHVGSYEYERPGRTVFDVHRFRLALTDFEALRRTREYLSDLDLATQEFDYHVAYAGARPMRAIRTSTRANVAAIKELIEWPHQPGVDWCDGFLAGIFDAEGSFSGGVLRIANTDPEIVDQTVRCLERLGFSWAVETRKGANPLTCVRVRGGMSEKLRFFHTVDPAISRKRSIEGFATKTVARLRVVSIEPLGEEIPLYDITTGTGDFIANGVVSHNCFARPTHTYLDFNADRDFEREIVVKVNTPEVARTELMRPSWKREHVALGTNTDPYQWVESKYELLPGVWEAMRDSGTPCSVLTKSPLLLRDIELFKRIPEFAANLSVPTLDEKAWRATEPHTPHPRKRLEAVAELNRAGIPTGILIAPLIPGVNDDPEQVEEIIEIATEAGAVSIGGICLHLRGEVKDIWFDWLRSHRPDLLPRYEKLYARGAYAPREEQERLSAMVSRRRRQDPPRRLGPRPDPGSNERRAPKEAPEPVQATLF